MKQELEKLVAKLTHIEQKATADGREFRILNLGGTEYTYWGHENLKAGEIVKIGFISTEKNGRTYKNIREIQVLEALEETTETTPIQTPQPPETPVKDVLEKRNTNLPTEIWGKLKTSGLNHEEIIGILEVLKMDVIEDLKEQRK